jgi:ribonuclease VapC
VATVAAFDASAVLAVLLNEPGGAAIAATLENALLSTVNLAEVHTRLLLRGIPSDRAWGRVQSLHCEACPFSEEQARIAAELITATKPYGLSLGDRACLALALDRKAAVYTTDRLWKSLPLGIEVQVIR